MAINAERFNFLSTDTNLPTAALGNQTTRGILNNSFNNGIKDIFGVTPEEGIKDTVNDIFGEDNVNSIKETFSDVKNAISPENVTSVTKGALDDISTRLSGGDPVIQSNVSSLLNQCNIDFEGNILNALLNMLGIFPGGYGLSSNNACLIPGLEEKISSATGGVYSAVSDVKSKEAMYTYALSKSALDNGLPNPYKEIVNSGFPQTPTILPGTIEPLIDAPRPFSIASIENSGNALFTSSIDDKNTLASITTLEVPEAQNYISKVNPSWLSDTLETYDYNKNDLEDNSIIYNYTQNKINNYYSDDVSIVNKDKSKLTYSEDLVKLHEENLMASSQSTSEINDLTVVTNSDDFIDSLRSFLSIA